VIAAEADRIHNTTNIAFEHLGAEGILILLGQAEVYASAGAACSSGSLEPSHVLTAMGLPEHIAHGAIRFSLSKQNTEAQIDRVIHVLPEIIAKLSALSR